MSFEARAYGKYFLLDKIATGGMAEVFRTRITGEKGFYVIQLKERKKPDLKEFDKEKGQINAMLLQQKKGAAFNTFLDEIRKKSEISIEEGVLN